MPSRTSLRNIKREGRAREAATSRRMRGRLPDGKISATTHFRLPQRSDAVPVKRNSPGKPLPLLYALIPECLPKILC